MTYKTLFFDLDDTVYSPTSGLWTAIGKRIDQYIHKKIDIPWNRVGLLRQEMYRKFGTTLRGLEIRYGIDKDEYLEYVHDVPLESFIGPDPELREVLLSYPQEKWIFTNADTNHAVRVLKVIGIDDCFNGIIDIKQLSPYCKPLMESYSIALEIAGHADPNTSVFLDDRYINLDPAKSLGFHTILVGRNNNSANNHVYIPSLNELPNVLIN